MSSEQGGPSGPERPEDPRTPLKRVKGFLEKLGGRRSEEPHRLGTIDIPLKGKLVGVQARALSESELAARQSMDEAQRMLFDGERRTRTVLDALTGFVREAMGERSDSMPNIDVTFIKGREEVPFSYVEQRSPRTGLPLITYRAGDLEVRQYEGSGFAVIEEQGGVVTQRSLTLGELDNLRETATQTRNADKARVTEHIPPPSPLQES